MYINSEYLAGVVPLSPQGTNSTFFTECCGCAICDDEPICPVCARKIVGHDAESNHERHNIRWKFATRHWKRYN